MRAAAGVQQGSLLGNRSSISALVITQTIARKGVLLDHSNLYLFRLLSRKVDVAQHLKFLSPHPFPPHQANHELAMVSRKTVFPVSFTVSKGCPAL